MSKNKALFKSEDETSERSLSPRVHQLLLLVAFCLPVIELIRFYYQSLRPIVHSWNDVQLMKKIELLVQIDILICIGFGLALIVLISFFLGRPNAPSKWIRRFHGRPILMFMITAPFLCLFLVLIPPILSRIFINLRDHHNLTETLFSLNRIYLYKSILVAIGFSISFADTVFRLQSKSARYGKILSLLYLISNIPLLWWNALERLAPSKATKVWRPLLAGATCLPLVLSFPLMQPIINASPHFKSVAHQELNDCDNAYQAAWIPGKEQFLLTCSKPQSKLGHYVKSPQGKWRLQSPMVMMDFIFNRAAFDFTRNLGYILDGNARTIHIVRLPSFDPVSIHELPLGTFPVNIFNVFPVFIPEKDILVAADETGFLASFDVANNFKPLASRYLTGGAQVWAVKYSIRQNELYVVKDEYLYGFDLDGLKPKRQCRLDGRISDILVDDSENRMFVAFAEKAQVKVLDINSFKLVATIDAPVGVRTLGMDKERRLLFVSSIGGILEIRNVDDLKRIHWMRVGKWIHWIEPNLPTAQIVITMGEFEPSAIMEYDPPKNHWNILDQMVKGLQPLLRLVMNSFVLSEEHRETTCDLEIPIYGNGDTILLFSGGDNYKNSLLVPSDKNSGFQMIFTDSKEEFFRLFEQSENEIDMVLVDLQYQNDLEFKSRVLDMVNAKHIWFDIKNDSN